MTTRSIYLIATILLTLNAVQADLLTDGDQAKFISAFLSAHNAYRKSVNKDLPNLKWDETLATFASKTASTCRLSYSTGDSRTNLAGFNFVGENLAAEAGALYTRQNMLRLPIAKQCL